MTITKRTTHTLWCDDGRYCGPDGNDFGEPNRASATLLVSSKGEAIRRGRQLGWVIRSNGTGMQCPACKRQTRIPKWNVS